MCSPTRPPSNTAPPPPRSNPNASSTIATSAASTTTSRSSPQTTALNNEVNEIDILRRRMDATVLLIQTLGGGWDRTQLPTP